MEKLNLLEKLKTLKQWQLQQQLNFTKLKNDNEFMIYNGSQSKDSSDNKENIQEDENKNIGKNCFTETMSKSSLTSALQNIDWNKMQIDDDDTSDQENKIQNRFLQSGDLTNWCMSGVQTVVLQNGKKNDIVLEENHDLESSYEEQEACSASRSEDEFSELELNHNMEGIQPLTETEEEEEDEEESDTNKRMFVVGADAINEEDEDGVDEENTLNEEEYLTNDEKPIKSVATGKTGGLTFEELIEKEMREDQSFASTPMKKVKHQFLKRGEGLKRFQCGNLKPRKKTENLGNNKDATASNRASTKPGLPLKLNLKKAVNRGGSKVTVSAANLGSNNAIKTKDAFTNNDGKKVQMLQSSRDNHVRNATDYNNDGARDSVSSSILEASFQKMLQQYSEKDELENNELDMFEALEDAAENISLSSNSSLVTKLLGKKKNATKVTDFAVTEEEHTDDDDGDDAYKQQVERQHDENIVQSRNNSFDFEDEASWSDTSQISSFFNENDETIVREPTPEHSTPPKRIISKRKVDVDVKEESELTPTPNENASSLGQSVVTDDISDTVKKKLAELENEINKFRCENDKLLKLRNERENEVKNLRKEIETFQSEKKEELESIKKYRDDEMKKLKTERKVFEKYQKACRAAPNKKERDEIKNLKEQVCNLTEELKSRETRWNSASHRFRTRIADLEEQNSELKREISVLENERLKRRKITTDSKEEQIRNKGGNKSPKHAGGHYLHSTHETQPKKQQCSQEQSNDLKNRSPVRMYEDILKHGEQDHFVSPSSRSDQPSKQFTNNNNNNINININSNNTKEIKHDDGKVEVILPDSSRLITYPNGTRKTISQDERNVSVVFFNGDIKRILPDNRVVYYYAESQTTHTTFPDGKEMIEFPNKQIENRYTDGRTEIIFPDKTVKCIAPNGCEETVFADGTIQKIDTQGVQTITFPNGQKEVHTTKYKRREYPNGTVKTVFGDGRQETKYSNGRLRVKDKDGNLLIDTGAS